jgi:hypothetical protein
MSFFGGNGFLGLGGTGFGNFVENTANSLSSAVQSGATFISRLPNELIQAGEQLGGRIYDTSGQTQQEFINQGRDFTARQTGGNVGSFLNNNFGMLAFFGGVLALIAVLSKK